MVHPRRFSRDVSYSSSVDEVIVKHEAQENSCSVQLDGCVKRTLPTVGGDGDDGDGRDNQTSGSMVEVYAPLDVPVEPDPRGALLLPTNLRTDDLPAEFREILIRIRENACTSCKERRMYCAQSSARSWKCQHCHETRKKCSWQVGTYPSFPLPNCCSDSFSECNQQGMGNGPPMKTQLSEETPQRKKRKVNGVGPFGNVVGPTQPRRSAGMKKGMVNGSSRLETPSLNRLSHPVLSGLPSASGDPPSLSTPLQGARDRASPPSQSLVPTLVTVISSVSAHMSKPQPISFPEHNTGELLHWHEFGTHVQSSNLRFTGFNEDLHTFEMNVDRREQEITEQFAKLKREIVALRRAAGHRDHRHVAVQTEDDNRSCVV